MLQELRGTHFDGDALAVYPGVRCWQVGVVERRSEEQSLRLEALPRSLL
jgi:hypothetical protein